MHNHTYQNQAAGLRARPGDASVKVIAVASGKGGVGKTTVSMNLAVALARAGESVMLLDADLGLANVDVMLGLQPRYNLSHVLSQQCAMDDVLLRGPEGVQIIPGASGMSGMSDLSVREQASLVNEFGGIGRSVDVMIVDTAAGISDCTRNFARACQEIVVVMCDEPASLTDAYALIKVMSREHGVSHFHVLPNMVNSVQTGRDLYAKLMRVTDKFLDVVVDFMGIVPADPYLKRAIQHQQSVVQRYPSSPASMAFMRLAKEVCGWNPRNQCAGHFQFFLDRLLQSETVLSSNE